MIRISRSTEETVAIGKTLAGSLKAGDVVALIGDLGSGKTVLTKGIARGLGVKNVRYVNSPTFVIIKEYSAKLPLYHLDVYRLNDLAMLDAESYEEYFYGRGVAVVEWADKIREILPKRYVEVRLSVVGDTGRRIEITRKK